MRISKTTFQFLQVTLVISVTGIFVFIAYQLITTEADNRARDAAKKASVSRVQASAFSYYSRLQYYDGVCADVGTTDEMSCTDSPDAFAVEVPLSNGTYYCADSTRFSGVITESKQRAVVCR